jgi:hypothetical protein
MPSSRMLRRVALAGPDVGEERIASIIRVTRIGELVTTLVVIIVFLRSVFRLLVTANVVSSSSKRRFLQELHFITSQKTAFFSHRRENLKSY